MKMIKSLALSAVFLLGALMIVNHAGAQHQHLIVLVKYKTLPGKDSVGFAGLQALVAKVKQEPNYVNIITHVDPADKTNILLYEEWSNEEYYKGEHLKTPHLRQFMIDSRSFLAGPPDISFWKATK